MDDDGIRDTVHIGFAIPSSIPQKKTHHKP